jgi:porphobilinogen synthase
MTAGINAFLLFGIPAHKDREGSEAWREDGIVQQALKTLRSRFPEVILITDVCLCEYTSHGHCGVLTEAGLVDNDQTLPLLAMTARSQAEAGADLVAPSDMMDGRVAAIRQVLDQKGLTQVGIMSYAVKYASSFYRPFRDTAGSRPAQGDRRNYQMDWHNRREASREAALDQAEGADILMVKPALAYLDVVAEVAATANRPVAAYSVSGEYAMLQAAAAAGLLDLEEAIAETAAGVFRAGADILVSYFAPEIATAIKRGDLG